jgi:hypothetical protein
VTPGIETGPLNVNNVRLSKVCAVLGVSITQASRATEQAKKTTRLSMFGPPVCVNK